MTKDEGRFTDENIDNKSSDLFKNQSHGGREDNDFPVAMERNEIGRNLLNTTCSSDSIEEVKAPAFRCCSTEGTSGKRISPCIFGKRSPRKYLCSDELTIPSLCMQERHHCDDSNSFSPNVINWRMSAPPSRSQTPSSAFSSHFESLIEEASYENDETIIGRTRSFSAETLSKSRKSPRIFDKGSPRNAMVGHIAPAPLSPVHERSQSVGCSTLSRNLINIRISESPLQPHSSSHVTLPNFFDPSTLENKPQRGRSDSYCDENEPSYEDTSFLCKNGGNGVQVVHSSLSCQIDNGVFSSFTPPMNSSKIANGETSLSPPSSLQRAFTGHRDSASIHVFPCPEKMIRATLDFNVSSPCSDSNVSPPHLSTSTSSDEATRGSRLWRRHTEPSYHSAGPETPQVTENCYSQLDEYCASNNPRGPNPYHTPLGASSCNMSGLDDDWADTEAADPRVLEKFENLFRMGESPRSLLLVARGLFAAKFSSCASNMK